MSTRLDVDAVGANLVAEVHEVGDHWSPNVDPDAGKLPLVLLNPTVGDRRCWHRVVPTWSTTRRVVTHDQRGAGESSWDPDAPCDHVADALAVLDAADVERAVVVGNSMGAAWALHLALDHPDRVGGLVLIGPGITGSPWPDTSDHEAVPPAALALDEAYDAALDAGDVDEAVRLSTHLWLDGWESTGPRADPAARELFEDMVRRVESAPPTGASPEREPAWPRLAHVAVPTMVVTGGLDLPYLNQRAIQAARQIPGARHVELPEAAHLPQLDGHLRLLAALTSFLEQTP